MLSFGTYAYMYKYKYQKYRVPTGIYYEGHTRSLLQYNQNAVWDTKLIANGDPMFIPIEITQEFMKFLNLKRFII